MRWGQARACAVQSAGQSPWCRCLPQPFGSAQPDYPLRLIQGQRLDLSGLNRRASTSVATLREM
jgi:hypothetical protein